MSLAFPLAVQAQAQPPPIHVHNKKIIEFGWDAPTPGFVRSHLADMEKRPFDGLVLFPGRGLPYLFKPSIWSPEVVEEEILASIPWKKLKHNFLLVWSNDDFAMDYFNDEHWQSIIANMRTLARAANKGGCAGILFDSEFYSKRSPWAYEDHIAAGRSRAEVEAKVRQRGGQVMAAWQSEFPAIKILSLYLFADAPNRYDMLPAFGNGLLDSLGPQATLIEGDEESYYWGTSNKWFERYGEYRGDFRTRRCKPENFAKFDKQYQVAKSVYADICYGVYPGVKPHQSNIANRKWLEHNFYAGLATTDEYVWLYNEAMSWWGNSGEDAPMGMPIASMVPWTGVEDAILSAKAKFESGQPLGWDRVGTVWDGGNIDSSIRVTLSGPVNASLPVATPLTLSIAVTGGAVTHVQLYRNAWAAGETRASPYRFEVRDLAAGNHRFFARAYTADGKHGTSGPLVITVAEKGTALRTHYFSQPDRTEGLVNPGYGKERVWNAQGRRFSSTPVNEWRLPVTKALKMGPNYVQP